MSGPIVRKYGFPNFDKIFGERPLQHGQENEPRAPVSPQEGTVADVAKAETETSKANASDRPKG